MTEFGKIGVCGAGAMGSGIALVAAQSGHSVVVYDVFAPSREKSEALIGKSLDQLVSRGKLDADKAAAVRANLVWTDDVALLADCDLVVEAIIEDIAAKQSLFTQLEEHVQPHAVIASNTSSLSIARLAGGLKRPERFVGMHFFNPATVMKLVEVVSGPATPPSVAEGIAQLARSWGKVAVPVADVPGFIVNRVARPFYAEGFRCVQQGGAAPELIDLLFRSAAGFRMGPLELTDLIGQDVNFAVARSVYESYFGQTRFTPQLPQAALVDANWLGRKTGRGVYDYAEGKGPAAPDASDGAALADAPQRPAVVSASLAGIEAEGVHIRFSNGRTARYVAKEIGRDVVVLDWFEGASAKAAGFSASSDAAAGIAAGLLKSWGLEAYRLEDRPGLIVLRTLAQIANAAGDAVLENVGDESGIDDALRFGANYPFGPCAWARQFGLAGLVDTLRAIAAGTGQAMYNPSEYWVSKA